MHSVYKSLFLIDPTYLITGEKNVFFDMERFLAKCNIEK